MNDNIELAINLKNKYLSDNSIDFPSELKKLGYESIDDFLMDDAEYFLENTIFKISYMDNPVEQSNDVIDSLQNKQDMVFIVTPESKFIWVGNNSEYNEEYCKQNNIPVLYEPYDGGVICTNKDDLQLAFCIYDMPTKFNRVIADKIVNWIYNNVSKNVSTTGNDILVDGKKVVGFGKHTLENGMVLLTVQVSFRVDLEFIKGVCKKTMNKEPVGLTDFNEEISREDLVWEVLKWLF